MTLNGPRLAPFSKGAAKQLVILAHGYGSNGNDLIGLASMWHRSLPDAAFVAPNAPFPCMGAGFQWWGLSSFSPAEMLTGIEMAAPIFDAFIDEELARYGLTEDDLLLVGFSQGTILSLHVAPRRARPVAGIIGFSGMLIVPEKLGPELQSRPPILLIHGESDDVIPVRAMADARSLLQGLEFDVESHVSPGLGHSVDQIGIDLAANFAQRVLLRNKD
jgi:phospholipase/carboxylesterase